MSRGLNASFRAFWDWWGGELASLIPKRILALFAPKAAVVAVRREGSGLVVGRRERNAGPMIRIDTSQLDDSAKRNMAIRAIRQQRRGKEPVAVILSPEEVIRSRIKLPAVAAENLREVLGYEMDGRTPFRADEVYYDFKVLGTDSNRTQIDIDLAVVPRGIVDGAVQEAAGWGVAPVSVGVADEWDHPERDYIFLESQAGRGKSRLGGYVITILLLAAISLGTVWVYLKLEHLKAEAELYANNVAFLKKEAEAAIQLNNQIEAFTQQRSFGFQKKKERYPVVAALNSLTELIPDDGWLIQFQVQGNTAQIQGYSSDAPKLVELIERSPRFRNATFRSRVTRDARTGAQRFHIAFEIIPEG